MTTRGWAGKPQDFPGGLGTNLLYSVMAAVVAIHISTFWRHHIASAKRIRNQIQPYQIRVCNAFGRAVAACSSGQEKEDATSSKVFQRLHLLHMQRLVDIALPLASFYCFMEFTIVIMVWLKAGKAGIQLPRCLRCQTTVH